MADNIVGIIASSINTTFKLAEFILSLQAASEEAHVFGQLIQRVRKDRAEAIRERKEKYEVLCQHLSKIQWINGIISDTDQALGTIGRIVENARVDGLKGRPITLQHRFEWVLKKKTDFLTKQHLLNTCHQSLLASIAYMHSLSPRAEAPEYLSPHIRPPPSYPYDNLENADHGNVIYSPSARRPKKRQEYVLPDSMSFTEGDDLDFGMDLYNPSSSTAADSNISRELSGQSEGSLWDINNPDEIERAAADAIRALGGDSQTVAAVAESLQRTTSDVRGKRREALYAEDPVPAPDVLGDTSRGERISMSPRTSMVNRRRRIEAHFELI